ncbi:hypothetical protein LIER_39976 [Lithospermum erythrorhizon]|uniref:Uncharacterized protein n=1 Tax=Lithospermum erythrorhizon TaxID=34254 RepID=A0AAV3QNT1_LITER
MEINARKSTNCLFDNWHRNGIPAEFLSDRSISVFRMKANDYVAQAKEGIGWPAGRGLTVEIATFKDGLTTRLREGDDRLIWFDLDSHRSAQHIWTARNKQIFEGEEQEAGVVAVRYVYAIKCRVNSWRSIVRSRANWRTCIKWGFDLAIFD